MSDIPIGRLLLLAAPLIIAQIALMTWALIDLYRREQVLGGNKILWAVLIIIINFIGPVLYLTLGRTAKNESHDE